MVRGRRVKARSNDRLSPSDLLKLIPSPIVLSDRSLAGYARRLEQRRERLQRLTARFAGKEFVTIPRQIHLPKLTRLEALAKEVETLPTRRKCLTRRSLESTWTPYARCRAIAGLMRKVQDAGHRADENRYLLKIAGLFLDSPPDVFESFISSRRPRSRKRRREWENDSPSSRNHAAASAATPSVSSPNGVPTPAAPEPG